MIWSSGQAICPIINHQFKYKTHTSLSHWGGFAIGFTTWPLEDLEQAARQRPAAGTLQFRCFQQCQVPRLALKDAQGLWWFDLCLFENRVMAPFKYLKSTRLSWFFVMVYHDLSRFITLFPINMHEYANLGGICIFTLFSDPPKLDKWRWPFLQRMWEPLLQVSTYHLRTRPEALLLVRLLQHPCGRWGFPCGGSMRISAP